MGCGDPAVLARHLLDKPDLPVRRPTVDAIRLRLGGDRADAVTRKGIVVDQDAIGWGTRSCLCGDEAIRFDAVYR